MKVGALIVAAITLAPFAVRGERPLPHVRAVRVSKSPTLDGKLDDPAWQAAPPLDSFVQKFPNEGAPPTEQTTIRVIYDAAAIWIGVDCRQRTAPIVGRLTRRD